MRGEEHGHNLKNISSQQKVRQFRDFLKHGVNKTSLIDFFARVWQTENYRSKLNEKVMYVTTGEKCYLINEGGSEEVEELQCSQEEADGRILLHAAHAGVNEQAPIIILAEDTDVFIPSLAFHSKIQVPLYQLFGKARHKLYDIHKVVASLGEEVCKALLGLHAFTGCDSVSAFAGKGIR